MQSMESCGGGARRGEAGGEDRMRPSLGDGQSWQLTRRFVFSRSLFQLPLTSVREADGSTNRGAGVGCAECPAEDSSLVTGSAL